MILKKINFSRYKGQRNEWSIEGKPLTGIEYQPVILQNINLVVGKNATGKSKTINTIRQLADLLSGDVKLSQLIYDTSVYDLSFENNEDQINYFLEYEKGKVKKEILKINGIKKLQRNSDGGTMFYEKANTTLDFQMEEDKLAVSRVDNIQQPFFEPLQNWGKTLSHYRFGGQLGKNALLRDISSIKDDKDIDLKDSDDVAEILIKGEKEFSNDFISRIITDMERISYSISSVKVDRLKTIPVSVFGLSVQENDIEDVTEQPECHKVCSEHYHF